MHTTGVGVCRNEGLVATVETLTGGVASKYAASSRA